MAAESTISSLVNRLPWNINKIEALDELRTAMVALPPTEIRNVIPNISISNVFDCMYTSDKAQQIACGEVLDRMFSILSSSVVLHNFHTQLLAWLRYPDNDVKSLCIPQVSRLSREVPVELCNHQDLVLAVVDLLPSENLDIGPASTAVLIQIGSTPEGLALLFSEPVLQRISSAMQTNDITRFRIYNMATDLSVRSPQALEATVQSGLLQRLVNEVQGGDVLLQLNAIELVSDLAQSPHGLVFLDQQGTVAQIEDMMTGLNNNPMAGLLLPGLIKFFGGLAGNHPKEVLSQFDHFVRLVLSSVSGSDLNLKSVSVDTIGFIGATVEGKLALEKLGNPLTECVTGLGSLIKTGTSELKARALKALTSLVHLPVEFQTTEMLTLTERWFGNSMSNPLGTVWSISRQPFSDIRVPALHMLQTVASCPWGQRQMNNVPGFKEYVLDRATEVTKEGKGEKFELVRVLAHSPTAIDIMGRPYHVKLMEYFNQGVFFVLAQSEVAMEGE